MSKPSTVLNEFKGVWEYLDKLSQNDPEAYAKFVTDQKKRLEEETKGNSGAFQAEPKFTLVAQLREHYISPATKNKPLEAKREDVEVHVMIVHMCEHEAVGPAQLKRGPEGKPAPESAHISSLLIPLSVGPILPAKKLSVSKISSSGHVVQHGSHTRSQPNVRVTEDVTKDELRAVRKLRQDQDPETAYITDDADEDDENLSDAGTARAFIQRCVRGARAKFRREMSKQTTTTGSLPNSSIEVVSSDQEISSSCVAEKKEISVRVRIWCVEVVFHPTIIARALRDVESKMAIIDLALLHISEDHSVTLERPYSILDKVPKIGTKLVHYTRETQEAKAASDKIFSDLMGTLQKNPEEEKAQTKKEIVLTSNLSPDSETTELLKEGLKLPSGSTLVSESTNTSIIRSTSSSQAETAVSKLQPKTLSQNSTQPSAPLIQTVKKEPPFLASAKNGTVSITVDISQETNGVESIEVDVSDTHWTVTSPMYYCMVPFPRPIRSDEAIAKFSKKKGTLTITAEFK